MRNEQSSWSVVYLDLKHLHNQWIYAGKAISDSKEFFNDLDDQLNEKVAKLVYKRVPDTRENEINLLHELTDFDMEIQQTSDKIRHGIMNLRESLRSSINERQKVKSVE